MCKAMETKCHCGEKPVNIHYKNNILPYEVVEAIYCPDCSKGVSASENTLLDNGWMIVYDMDVAKGFSQKMNVPEDRVTPDFIFESGYCTWNGLSPDDIYKSAVEKEAIKAQAKTNPLDYIEKIKEWTKNHIKKMSDEGWRKAKIVLKDMEG